MVVDGIDVSGILKGRDDDELRLIGCLLNNMTLMDSVKLTSEMFYFDMTKTLFEVIFSLYHRGFNEIDRHSVSKVLQDDKELNNKWEGSFLSFESVEILTKEYAGTEADLENYYDEVLKTHTVVKVYVNNIKTNVMLAQKYSTVSLEDLKTVVEYNANEIFMEGVKCDELSMEFTPEDLDALIEGSGIGVPYGLNFMSKKTNGLHLGGLNILAGSKGTGKSTIMLTNFCMSVVEEGEDIVIVSNEMTRTKMQNILIPYIMATKFGEFKLSRTKFLTGNFAGVDMALLGDAILYFNELMKQVTVIWQKSFTKEALLGIVRKYARQGKKYFFFDTFKSDFSDSDNLTTKLMNIIQNLSQECIDLNVFGLATMQLKTTGKHRRYLDDSALARCTEAGQDLDTLWLLRDIFDDEYDGEGYDLNPYMYVKEKGQTKVQSFKLKRDKNYIVMFLDKNRYGDDGVVTIAEKNTAFSLFSEKGYVTISNAPTYRNAG